jgi:hypothetical protein
MHSLFSSSVPPSQQRGRYPYAQFHSSLSSSSAAANNRSAHGPPQSHCGFGQSRTLPPANKVDPGEAVMSQVQAMKKQVAQLHQEATMQRITVSQACEE